MSRVMRNMFCICEHKGLVVLLLLPETEIPTLLNCQLPYSQVCVGLCRKHSIEKLYVKLHILPSQAGPKYN